MTSKELLKEYQNIADIHAEKLAMALLEAQKIAPFTPEKFVGLTNVQTAFLDMLSTRFSKLQDIIGAKIFPCILDSLAEDAITFIDKLYRLEKLNYISDANWWMQLREIRNQITHDYPDDYVLLSQHFNIFILRVDELLDFWKQLKEKL